MIKADKTITPLSPAAIEKIISNQTKELELRSGELEIKKQADNNLHDYSKSLLQAQAQDKQNERMDVRQSKRELYVFIFAIVAVFCILGAIAFKYGYKDAGMEIIKALIYISAGGIGGYSIPRLKQE